MKALKLTVLSWILASVAVAADAQPEFLTKEVTGEAAIVGVNLEKAFQDAKNAALREAVEQVAGVMVSSDTLTSNSQLISDRIFTNSAGYIRKYDVLARKEERGVMKVTVRAEVGAAQLDKDLQAVQALIRRLGGSRLLIVIQEQSIGSDKVIISSGHMAQQLTESFQKDGWRIIDPSYAAGKLEAASGISLLSPEKKVIQDLRSADYVITGVVTLRHETPTTVFGAVSGQEIRGWYPVTGEWELSVFATDSGTQIARLSDKFDSNPKNLSPGDTLTVSYERTAFSIIKARGKIVVEQARKSVVEYLSKAEQNGNSVVVTVTGLSDYAAVSAFKKVLAESITGMRDVRQGDFKQGKATFDVVFVGTTDSFAEAVGQKTYKGKKVSVTGVTGNTIELTLAR
ncbi:MAG TPA: flagellar assembly protein T N-terminal domain-containing protein [Hyalangium sp.]|nr:flagellar assembly protein T N-terminal domain-containing protein [Hyalangium sp.]